MTMMMRVKDETHAMLSELAEQEDATMQDVLAMAVEQYRRQRILEETNAAYAALRADEVAWREYQMEMAAWDNTLMDGMEIE